jgi:hypothetical protein
LTNEFKKKKIFFFFYLLLQEFNVPPNAPARSWLSPDEAACRFRSFGSAVNLSDRAIRELGVVPPPEGSFELFPSGPAWVPPPFGGDN